MIIGHERSIKDLIELADKGELSHGYLFWGAERVGKKTVALACANYLENGTFEMTDKILSDCRLVVPNDEGSIGIDEVREIRYFLWQKPNRSPYRTVIIDHGELLTSEAQDALLKITEEPPASALMIVVINDPELLIPTLRSRFQAIYFGPVHEKDIERWLIARAGIPQTQARTTALLSFNQPGRAWAAIHDEAFQALSDSARTFLALPHSKKKDFIKELVSDDAFRFEIFLDVLIAEVVHKKKFELWHELLELRRKASFFNLNPRIQLENLATNNESGANFRIGKFADL